jgi:O-antigen/teichoic acid export membrane protein
MLKTIGRDLKQGKTLLQFGFLKGLGQALGMVVPLVIAKFFTEELFGSYSLAKMVIFFFSTLLIASSQTPFVVYANQERTQTGKINKSFSVQLAFFVFGIAAFLFAVSVFGKQIRSLAEVSSVDLLFMALGYAGIALKSFFCSLFMALGQRVKNALAEFVFGGLTLVLVLGLSVIGAINLRTVFLVYFVSATAVLAVFMRAIDFSQLLPFTFAFAHFKKMFDFAKWVMFGATVIYFINWVDPIVLKAFGASLADIGEYSLGYQVFKGVVMLSFIVNTYFLPFVSQHINDAAKMRNYLFNKRPKIFLLGLVAIGLLFLLSPYIFKLVYGDAFPNSVTVMRILLIASVLVLYGIFYTPVFNVLKRYKFTQTSLITQLLLKLGLSIILIPRMGVHGAAVATVLAYLWRVATFEVYFRVKVKRLVLG